MEQSAKLNKKPSARLIRQRRIAYAILIPTFVYISLWSVVPMIYGLYLSLTEYNGLSEPVFIGLENFKTFFSTKNSMVLLWRQLWIGAICLLLNTVISFFLGLSLNVQSRLRGFFRASVYVPTIAATSITTAIFVALLEPNGALNTLIKTLGGKPVTWTYSQAWMVFWVAVYFIWRNVGPAAVIWLGGLQSIDPSLYEAAKVDGANAPQRVWYITIPGLRFVASYIILTGIIGTMQMFDVIMFITGGAPYGKTDVLMYKLYRDGIKNFNLGLASTESVILGLATMVFAVLYFMLMFRKGKDE